MVIRNYIRINFYAFLCSSKLILKKFIKYWRKSKLKSNLLCNALTEAVLLGRFIRPLSAILFWKQVISSSFWQKNGLNGRQVLYINRVLIVFWVRTYLLTTKTCLLLQSFYTLTSKSYLIAELYLNMFLFLSYLIIG